MSKHTPGPWEIGRPAFGEQHIYVSSGHTVRGEPVKSGRQHICVLPYEGKRGAVAYHEMFNANARLIAAAPDLLAALKDTHALLQATLLIINDPEARSIAKQQLDSNRAAIAKATGGGQ